MLRWKNLDGSSPIPDTLKSTSLSRHTCHISSSTTPVLTAHSCGRDHSHCYRHLIAGLSLCKIKRTTSGHIADTHGLRSYEPNLTNNQLVAAWVDVQNSDGAQAGYGPISSVPPWRSTRKSQRKRTITIIGNYWQSNMFTGRSKAEML